MRAFFRWLMIVSIVLGGWAAPTPISQASAGGITVSTAPAPPIQTSSAAFGLNGPPQPSVVQAAGSQQYIDGPVLHSTVTNCFSLYQNFPYLEPGISASVGFSAEPHAAQPGVGQVYYVHLVIKGLGNSCSGQWARTEIQLPGSTALAISAANPVQCVINGVVHPNGCPQSLPASSVHPGAFVIPTADTSHNQDWPIPAGWVYEFQIPVTSSAPLTNDLLQAYLWAIDGNANPWLNPQVQVTVFGSTPAIVYPSPSTTDLTASAARSTAWLYTHGLGGTVYFDLGTDLTYSLLSLNGPIPAGMTAFVSYTTWGFAFSPNTLYHWRERFKDSNNVEYIGADQTFQTLPDGQVTVGSGNQAGCTGAAFDAALATPGVKSIVFNCAPYPVTIALTGPKTISSSLIIDGGNLITLQSNGTFRLFDVSGTLTLKNLTLTGGSSPTCGGAVHVNGPNYSLVLNGVRITGNSSAGNGGGLCVEQGGGATITNSQFNANHANGSGGGVYITGVVDIIGSDISGNSAGNNGGGVAVAAGGAAYITASTVAGNSTPSDGVGVLPGTQAGGGIYNAGSLTINTSSVAVNTASFGGGIYNAGGQASITLSTIAGNAANTGTKKAGPSFDQAGGLDSTNGGLVNLINSILAGNTSAGLPGNCGATQPNTISSQGHNLDSAAQCFTPATGDLVNTDPLLGALAFNGGQTRTLALLPGSPAIDTGDNTLCGIHDQRGYPRPTNGSGLGVICDIGAYEYKRLPPTISALSPSTVAAGGPAFTLTVSGADFISGSVVRWKGADRPTTFLSNTQLSASISAADVAAGGPFEISVYTPPPDGGTSTTLSLTLYARISNDTAADLVFGQPDFSSSGRNNPNLPGGANRFDSPTSVAVDRNNGRLFVTDHDNNRVLSWPNAAALANAQAADLVIGQPNFATHDINHGGLSAKSLARPYAVAVDGSGNLYVADTDNNRVLQYLAPLSSGMAASRVFGQNNSPTSGGANLGGVSASSLNFPDWVAVDSLGNLFVADTSNHRVLEYNAPLSSDTIADHVFGQADFSSNTPNNGGVSAVSLYYPYGMALDSAGNLYVADFGNNRVLEYNAPLASGMAASRVFGQGGSFTSNSPNLGGISDDSLKQPVGVALDINSNLYVVDFGTSRVLEYNTPLTRDVTADRVYGQPDFTSGLANQGGIQAQSLNFPDGLAIDTSGNLFVADYGNRRVLEFDLTPPVSVPTLSSLSPSSVAAGSPAFTLTVNGTDFVSGSIVRWDGSDRPTTYIDSTRLSAAIPAEDVVPSGPGSGLVSVYNPPPGSATSTALSLTLYARAANDASADAVFGQPNFSASTANSPLLPGLANRLDRPTASAVDPQTGRIFTVDYNNNRVLSWPNAAALANSQAADLVIGQPNLFTNDANHAGISASSLNLAEGVALDSQGNLYVADTHNHRVLIFDAPLTSGKAAARVIGQPGFVTNSPSAAGLNLPTGVALDAAGNLYVADYGNNRVLEYNAPLVNGAPPARVFGQPDFISAAANASGLSASSLSSPSGVALDGQGNLYVADSINQRVLEYDTPLTGGTMADRVFGQPGFSSSAANTPALGAGSLFNPYGVAIDPLGNLYVADSGNNRVVEYRKPLSSDTLADRVFGQADFTHNPVGVSATGLTTPLGVTVDAHGNLYVADFGSNRLLVFDLIVVHVLLPLIRR